MSNLKFLQSLLVYFTLNLNFLTAQGLGVNSCPEIEKRNNGNGQASSAAGNFTPYSQNNPVASNVTGTSYQFVPFDPASKTGNFNFRWPGSAAITNLPVVTRVWLTSTSNVTTLSPIVFGPPPPATVSGNFNYVNYCFYVQNMPPSGRVTLEFTNPQTGIPAFRCTYDLSGNTTATAPTDLVCTPTISTNPLSQTFCGNGSVTFTAAQTGASSYQWQYSANGGSSWTNISLGGNFTTLNSTTLTVANRNTYNGNLFRIVYTNSCGSVNSNNATLTVNTLPTAVFTNSSSLCGLNVTRSIGIDFTGIGPWSVTYTTNGTPTTVSNITTDPFYVSVTPSSTSTYIITSVSDSKCANSSLSGNTSISVNPIPTVTPTNSSVCIGNNSFSLSYSSTNSPDQYSITTGTRVLTGFTPITNATLTGSPLSITIPTTGITVGTYDFNMVVSNSSTGCSSVSSPFTLTVNSLPNVGATASNSSICAGSTATLTASPSNLSSYAWRINPSATILGSSVSYSPTVNSNTTYTVTGTDANGCSSTADVSITTTAGSPISIIPSSPTICSGNAVTLVASGANSYSWSPSTGLSSTSDDQVVASPTTTTTYTVTASNLTGCQSIGTVTVTVATAPISVTSNSTICAGTSKTLTASGGSTYTWYPSTGLFTDAGCTVAYAGTNVSTVYAKPSSTTTYYVSGTTAGGCNGVASSTVSISSAPVNLATSTPNNLIFCTQGVTSFPLNVVMTEAVSSATWSYSTNGTTYTSFTTATVITGVTITPTSSGTAPNVTYTCTLSAYGSAGYTGARYFRLTLAGATCNYDYDIFVTDTKKISATPAPTATQTTICNGDFVTLTIGALASGSTAQWQSSPNNSTWTNISGATSASYTTGALSSTTYYRVLYNGGSGNCGSTTSAATITVNTALSANTLSPSSTCSLGSGTITITGSSITSGIYQWQRSTTSSSDGFSDILGAVSQNYTLPNNIASTQTWYRRTATNGTCLSNTSAAVVVTPPITGNYISTSTISYCNGTAPSLTLSGTTPIGGNGTYTYQWQSSSDGTTFSNIPSTNAINYTTASSNSSIWYRRIVTSDQCSGDNSNTIKITVNSNPSIGVTSSATICSGSQKSLTASGGVSYSWSPSTYLSGATGTSVVSTPTATTTYTVTGTDANGCTNTANTTVTVTSLPSTPTISPSSKTICSNASQNLNSLVTSGGSYAWYTVPEANASYAVSSPTSVSSSGNYYVFVSNGGCFSSSPATFVLTVNNVSAPTPILNSIAVCSPATVDLTSLQPLANTGTALEWHTASSNPSAGNLYGSPTEATAGTYYLYAYSTDGTCYGSASSAVTVTQNSRPTITPSPNTLSTCSPGTVDLTSTTASQGGIYYQWYTGNDNPPNASLLINSPSSVGTSGTYYVYAFNNSTGCVSSSPSSVTVIINAVPALTMTAPTVACSGTTNLTLSVSVTNGITSPTYQWQKYNATSLGWDNMSDGGVYSGTASATLNVSSNTGLDGTAFRCNVSKNSCSSNSDIGVIGVSQPNVPSTLLTHPNCSVSDGKVEVTSYPVNQQFSLADPNGYQSSTTFNSVASGTYTLTVKDDLNCKNTTTVTINPQPAVPLAPTTTNASTCVYNTPGGTVANNTGNAFSSPVFKWYTIASGDTSTNYVQRNTSTTLLNNIMSTTTYYVSIVHPVTGCESSRTSVTNTIIDPLSTYTPINNDYIWKGGASQDINNWKTATNWYQYDGSVYKTVNTIPGSADNAIIPPSGSCVTDQPRIKNENTEQFVNLHIKSGGVLTVEDGGVINVTGNWKNDGTFNRGSGTVYFKGSGNHVIEGSSTTTFHNLVVNKPLNGSDKSVLTLNVQAHIAGELTLTAGLFDISTFDINMDGRAINGGSTASYVRTSSTGRLQRDVASTSKLFPVGRSSYNPATLTNAGTADKYSIRLIDRLTNIGINAESDNQSDSSVVKRTWMIDEGNAGGSDVTLRLDWNGEGEHQTGFDPTVPYIAHYNIAQSKWENKGWSTRTYSAGQGFVQTTGITNFSPFGISSPEGGVTLPVEFIYFNSSCEDELVLCEWATASEHNSDYFSIQTSSDGYEWREIEKIKSAGFSNEKLVYSYIINNKSYNYLKLNQFDIDGRMETFGPFNISCEANDKELTIYPNPTEEFVNIQLEVNENDSEGQIQVINLDGKLLKYFQSEMKRGMNYHRIDLSEIPKGVYYIEVIENKYVHRKKIVII